MLLEARGQDRSSPIKWKNAIINNQVARIVSRMAKLGR